MTRKLLLGIAALLTVATSQASEKGDTITLLRPVTSAYMIGAGSSHLADTYLSPLKYSGWHVDFHYERMQAMKFNPERWVMQMRTGVQADKAMSPAQNSYLWYWGLDFSWGMMHRWKLPCNITLAAGGNVMLDAGVIYNKRNSNNPCAAKAALTLGVTGYAAWNLKLGRLPITLRYQPEMPVIGAFFSPDYGELYYEIYLGNHSGLAHCAWWGNHLRYDHQLTADLHLGSTSLRIGYSGSILSTKVNHLVTHIFTHAAVVGISGEWISLNPRKTISQHAKTISALY